MVKFNERKTVKKWAQEIVRVLGAAPDHWLTRDQIAQSIMPVPMRGDKVRRKKKALNSAQRTVLDMLVVFGYVRQREGRSDVPNVEFRYEYQLVEAPHFEEDK